ncbi:MAG: hypothetical protein U1E28_21905 [Beijerinckiaceae bacterium]
MRPLEAPRLRVVSFGGGVQSTTLLLMAAHGLIDPMPDMAIFVDLGSETAATYDHIRWMASGNVLPFPIHTIDGGDLAADLQDGAGSDFGLPWFLDLGRGRQGLGRRECTARYKVQRLTTEYKRLLGYGPHKNIPPNSIEVWLGISTDEVYRVKPARGNWETRRWPLIELRMSRRDCAAWLREHDYPVPVRSSCAFCPFHSDQEWLRIKTSDPQAWRLAVEIDASLRRPGGRSDRRRLRGVPYLHRSMQPLDQIEFGSDAQPDLFLNECEGLCGA